MRTDLRVCRNAYMIYRVAKVFNQEGLKNRFLNAECKILIWTKILIFNYIINRFSFRIFYCLIYFNLGLSIGGFEGINF